MTNVYLWLWPYFAGPAFFVFSDFLLREGDKSKRMVRLALVWFCCFCIFCIFYLFVFNFRSRERDNRTKRGNLDFGLILLVLHTTAAAASPPQALLSMPSYWNARKELWKQHNSEPEFQVNRLKNKLNYLQNHCS